MPQANLYLTVIASAGGKFRWLRLYTNQKKGVFMDSHVRFFEYIGGTYLEVVYDNPEKCCEEIHRQKREIIKPGFGENVDVLRLENGTQRRIKEAKFPYKKYLCDFERGKYGNEFDDEFHELETLDFIGKNENIILCGQNALRN
ncbi:MAG: hypothetical protein FWG45_05520 [Oscillospiraceae bacterium]|nr:hypothetical protein [Oscillospiraceae bacterium]